MTPDWILQLLWWVAGVGGTGAVWYFLSQRQFQAALWVGFATVVLVSLNVTLYVRNSILVREQQRLAASPEPPRASPASPAPQGPSADDIAKAVASRLPAPPREKRVYSGPFPPFSLGGSLDQQDFRDVHLTFRDWKGVPKATDVTIDWDSIGPPADLVVYATVKGEYGVCRVGLLDVGNDVVVSQSPPIAVQRSESIVKFRIPREAGTKFYRLVTRGSDDNSTAYFGVIAKIDFPIFSLGGSAVLPSPAAGFDWRPVDDFHDVEIDWSQVQPPINKVLIDAEFFVSDYTPGESSRPPAGRGRIRLRNLRDNAIVAESDWVQAGPRSMHHSYQPGRGTLRAELPRAKGHVSYRLEVIGFGPVVAVAATGRLLLRH